MKKIILSLMIGIFLVGCNKDIEEDAVMVNVAKSNQNIELYNVYVKEDYTLKKYEPEGVYTGVFLEQTEGEFIKEFEEYTNVKNSIYMYSQKIDESYPLSWVLNCYSNLKTPFITILPSDDEKYIFDTKHLKNLAKDFGNLQIPMFVNIYPVDNSFIGKNTEYIKFLQDAKTYFNLYAPNVCLVFSIDKDLAYNVKDFYPGDNYVDWVGLNIYENIQEHNKLDIMFKELDFFYKSYAYKKPIFLNIAISHFASTSYNYNIDDKIKELDRYFKYMPSKYERIKMINYINIDTFKTEKVNKQNYLLTDNKKILNAYEDALNNDIFLDTVIFADNKRKIIQENKLNCLVYKINNNFFIDDRYFQLNNLKIEDIYLQNTVEIDGKKYYNIENVLKNNNMKMVVDDLNKKVVLNKN